MSCLAADCMCQRKIYDYLARGHEFHFWLLIACVSEKMYAYFDQGP
jgi:hypothetical protein